MSGEEDIRQLLATYERALNTCDTALAVSQLSRWGRRGMTTVCSP